MTPERRKKTPRVLAVLAFAIAVLLGSAQGATALGWSPVVNCSGGGQLSGRSYQITFSNAGGNTYADNGCGGSIRASSIAVRYQSYPGGPYYTTSQYVVQGSVASRTQSGTWNGYHRAFNSSGGQVGYTSS